MVQQVLNLPELKIAKPLDTIWLAHERCAKAVKASCGAIVTALDDIHENTNEPEALGLSKVLTKGNIVAAVYVLDYVLPQWQVAKLSRTLQLIHLTYLRMERKHLLHYWHTMGQKNQLRPWMEFQ